MPRACASCFHNVIALRERCSCCVLLRYLTCGLLYARSCATLTLLLLQPTLSFANATVNTTAEPHKPQLYEVMQSGSSSAEVYGREVAVVDELPTVPGLQISLDAAEARLFLIGSAG